MLTPLLLIHQTPAETKPNFVVIMADDLGYGDLSATGSLQIQTPNIDRIANEGTNYTQAYVSAPVCAPSRSGFLTGRYQNRFGCEYNMVNPAPGHDPELVGLPSTETTLPERLQALGYRTGLIGKWHQGDKPQFHPLNHGFDEFYGFIPGSHDYFKGPLESNVEDPKPITYLTDDLGDAGNRFIDRNANQPFFLFLSYNAPHTPMQATEEDLKLYDFIPQQRRKTYAAMVHRLDVNVGKLLDHLESKDLLDNTVVVFLSDNGGAGPTNHSVNAPYRGQKGCVLEGGIRVPFFVRYPNAFPATTSDQPIISLDLTPTFVNLAGGQVPAQETDGLNLVTLLQSPNKSRQLFWKFGPTRALREGPHKLLIAEDRLPALYNLNQDPSEQSPIRNQAQANIMLRQHSDWMDTLAYPLYHEQPIWRRRQLDHLDTTYPLTQPNKTDRLEWINPN